MHASQAREVASVRSAVPCGVDDAQRKGFEPRPPPWSLKSWNSLVVGLSYANSSMRRTCSWKSCSLTHRIRSGALRPARSVFTAPPPAPGTM